MHRVAVLCKSIPVYRTRFFELLRSHLEQRDIELVVLYGQPAEAEAARRDAADIPWARPLLNRPIRLAGRELIWQSAGQEDLRRVDLVIVEQASRLLLNYALQFRYWLGGPRFAFWGHGRNFQAESASHLGEAVKKFVSRRVHWWFAYNDSSARIVRQLGFPDERITSVQNAIDTRELRALRKALPEELLQKTRRELSLVGRNVCIYSGALYREKRIAFLLEAACRIRHRVPDFELIVMGGGPDVGLAEAAAAAHPWIKYVGPAFGQKKVAHFALSKLFLLPGAVGLAVLDSFALEVPLVTAAASNHGPEIEYLRSGENGVVVMDGHDPQAFASVTVDLLQNDGARTLLQNGCRVAADEYTVEKMAERFADGVRRALV